MFKRLHDRGAYGGGTGSGLAIVKKIIDRHGGKIWTEPNEGGGAAFYFTLGAPDKARVVFEPPPGWDDK